MAFDKVKENIDDIKVNTRSFVDANLDYFTLLGFKITTKASSLIVKIILLSLFLLLSLIFLSFALAYAIGIWIENNALGFLIVGGIYILISLILYFKGGNFIDRPMIKTFSEIFFND